MQFIVERKKFRRPLMFFQSNVNVLFDIFVKSLYNDFKCSFLA